MVLAFIPARGGSKSIPLKNIKEFCGKPLIYWSIKALEEVKEVDNIIVATDSEKIEEIVNMFSFSKVNIYKRNSENAQDYSSTESVMLEFLRGKNFLTEDLFMLVQVTSPFTQSMHYAEGIRFLKQNNYDSVLSGVISKRFFWKDNGTSFNYSYEDRPRRQDFKGLFMENGAFYISKIGNIIKYQNRLSGRIGLYEMPEYTGYELDEPEDWNTCEQLMKKYVLSQNFPENDIKLFISDVDGVLTDSGMYYSETGDELKKFNTLDGKAFELLRNKGIKTAIITSENTKIVENRAHKLKIDYLYQGIQDKLSVVKEICLEENITIEQVAFVGDDIGDYDAMLKVGVSFCPSTAVDEIKKISNICLSKKGGEGCVREAVEILMSNILEVNSL